MSQLAYETDEPDKMRDILALWGLRLVDGGVVVESTHAVFPMASTHCFVAAGRNATFVTFAGTDPLVLANLVTDFDARLDAAGIAEGYKAAADVVWARLRAVIAASMAAGGNLFIAGHSLGGALAAITAHRLVTELDAPVTAVYTFGMPRPGSPAFAAAYDQRLGMCTYRLVQGEDIVPTVAPSFLGFRHLGRYLHCDRGAKFDAARLSPGTESDEPLFIEGVSNDFARLLQRPLSGIVSMATRLKVAAALVAGVGPAGMRTDTGGIAIELLPPRLRDHMPDRYIDGF